MMNSNQRNVIRGTGAFLVIIIIILSLRLCGQDRKEVPSPQPPPPATSRVSPPHESTRMDSSAVFPIVWKKAAGKQSGKKVTATHIPLPTQEAAVEEKKEEPVPVQDSLEVQPSKEPGFVETAMDPAETSRSPEQGLIFHHKRYYQLRIGMRAGIGYSSIGNLAALIEDGSFRPRNTMEESGSLVPAIGVFALWRSDRLGIELAADYTCLSSTLKEHKEIDGTDEKTAFRYHLILPQASVRLYLLSDFYMGAGVGVGIPINPGGIDFSSNRAAEFAPADGLTREHLRESLRARPHFMPLLKIGYSSFRNGIEASLQYSYGAGNLIRTEENPYGYHRATNNSHLLQLTVGYTILLNKKK